MKKALFLVIPLLLSGSVFAQDEAKDDDNQRVMSEEEFTQELERLTHSATDLLNHSRELLEQVDPNQMARVSENVLEHWIDLIHELDHAEIYKLDVNQGRNWLPQWRDEVQFGFAALHNEVDAFLGISLDVTEDGLLVSGMNIDEATTTLREGDLLLSINDVDLTASENPFPVLKGELGKVEPESTVQVIVHRDDKAVELSVPTFTASAVGLGPLFPRNFGSDQREYVRALREGFERGQFFPNNPSSNITFLRNSPRQMLQVLDMQTELASFFDVEQGVLIVSAPEDEDMELKAGDLIVGVGGISTNSASQIRGILNYLDQSVELTIVRKGKELKVEVDPKDLLSSWAPLGTDSRHGLHMIDVQSDLGGYFGVDEGILVTQTRKGSELDVGDVVRSIGNIQVQSARQATGILLQLNQPVEVTVQRGKKTQKVEVEPLNRTRLRPRQSLGDRR